MKRFITNILLVSVIVFIINAVNPVIGLYKLRKSYRLPLNTATKLRNPNNSTQKHTLIIGCSNVQHDVDFKMVQDSINFDVDFLYFSGAETSTFLQFLFENGYTAGYDNVILYGPYHILQRSSVMTIDNFFYRIYGCYEYTKSNIIHNPSKFFYNWSAFYDSIAHNRKSDPNDIGVTPLDHQMDSLNTPGTSYTECNAPFKREKHTIEVPQYTGSDLSLINSFKKYNKHIFIICPPIPNIPDNIRNVQMSNIKTVGFKNLLNEPRILDSTLFFDQWYHLNKCGRASETAYLIHLLRTKYYPALSSAD